MLLLQEGVIHVSHNVLSQVESGLVMHQYQCNGVLAGIFFFISKTHIME